MSVYVLITGASRGIGRETALKFAKEGYGLIINCRTSQEKLIELRDEILSYNVPCITFIKDVSQFNEVSEMFDELTGMNALPDIIINNAGISYIGLLQNMTDDDWQNIINTNLSSVFNICRHGIPHLIKQQKGCIVNVSSMWGNTGASCEVAYSASKGGVNSFTKALAKELAPSNIPVNAIAFGVIDTEMNGFLAPEERECLIEEIPAGKFLSPAEAADIIYKTTQMNSYVTGQIITADGGLT